MQPGRRHDYQVVGQCGRIFAAKRVQDIYQTNSSDVYFLPAWGRDGGSHSAARDS